MIIKAKELINISQRGGHMSIDVNNVGKVIEKNKGRKTLDSSITIRIDDATKSQFEEICRNMGLTVSSAISAFIAKVLNVRGMPFEVSEKKRERKLGLLDGKYDIPDDIHVLDDEVLDMFGLENL